MSEIGQTSGYILESMRRQTVIAIVLLLVVILLTGLVSVLQLEGALSR